MPPLEIPFWKKTVFAMVICLAVFALVELVLAVADVETVLEREDPFRGFSGLVPIFERHDDRYRTSPALLDTFNDQSFLADKPRDGLLLFTIGGSSAYGFPWGAEAAFTAIVGDALAARHPSRRVEAVNAAGVSYAMHRLNLVTDELLRHDPDVIVVYGGHNEFVEPAFFDALRRRSDTHNRIEYLASHSRLYSVMRSAMRGDPGERDMPRTAGREFGTKVRRDQTRRYAREEKSAIVDEFRWRLERLVGRVRAAGVHVVLVTVPANLREWRPEASTGTATLTDTDRDAWSSAWLAGSRALDRSAFGDAVDRLETATRLAPEHAESWFELGRAYEGIERWDAAREAYRRACDTDATPVRRVSGINDAIREVAAAAGVPLVDADRLFEADSEHGLVGFELIEDYAHPTRTGHELIAWHLWEAIEQATWFGEPAADRAVFDRIAAERRDGALSRARQPNVQWFYNQGVVLGDRGHLDAAIDAYRRALELQPDYPGALLNLGALLRETGRHAEAVDLLERLVAIDPDDALAHGNLGNALEGLGRSEEAIARYREAIRLDPDLAHTRNNWGNALQSLGRMDEAIVQYERAVGIEPGFAEAHANWGVALAGLGRRTEAIERYREAILIAPDYTEVYIRLAHAFQAEHRFDEAISHYEASLRLEPRHPVALRDFAWLLATCADDSVRDGARALELATPLADLRGGGRFTFLDTLAAVHAELGRFDDAIRLQREALRLAPASRREEIERRLSAYRDGRAYRIQR